MFNRFYIFILWYSVEQIVFNTAVYTMDNNCNFCRIAIVNIIVEYRVQLGTNIEFIGMHLCIDG